MEQLYEVPIEQAALIGERFEKDQVIILTIDRKNQSSMVVTWGRTRIDADLAALKGIDFKNVIGWPELKSSNISNRLFEIREDLQTIRSQILNNVELFGGGEKVNRIFDILNKSISKINGEGFGYEG